MFDGMGLIDVLETSGHLICQTCRELRLFGYFISVGC